MSAVGRSARDVENVLEQVVAHRVIPVVAVPSTDAAVRLATVLADNGLPVVEVTLRTPGALDSIAAIVKARPDVLVGAGTLVASSAVEAAAAVGASFGVSPGFDPSLTEAARTARLPYVPGVATAGEVQRALAAEHRILKFFPAEAAGGRAALAALAAPFAPFDVRFMPTGGIGEDTAGAWLERPEVVAVGGSWIAPTGDLIEGRWEAIAARVRAVRSLAGAAA